MKIWHVGALSSLQAVDGCNNVIWSLAKEQAALGHLVRLIVDSPPDVATQAIALANPRLKLFYITANRWSYEPNALAQLLNSEPPEVVHFHSVFIPKQASLSRQLKQSGIPYVITSHGRVVARLFERGCLKKYLYNGLIEKARFRGASAITIVTPQEEAEIRAFIPDYKGLLHYVFNPLEVSALSHDSWQGKTKTMRLVYLGRFDILVKGIDRLIEVARLLPEVEIHLYGNEDPKTKKWLEKLKVNLPSNVYFHPPVFGAEKIQVLKNAALYIQMSRQEIFGMAIAEAMCIGTPCAIADKLNIAELFRDHDLGLILPSNVRLAANAIAEALKSEARLQGWSERAKQFAQTHFQVSEVTKSYLQLYEKVLDLESKSVKKKVFNL